MLVLVLVLVAWGWVVVVLLPELVVVVVMVARPCACYDCCCCCCGKPDYSAASCPARPLPPSRLCSLLRRRRQSDPWGKEEAPSFTTVLRLMVCVCVGGIVVLSSLTAGACGATAATTAGRGESLRLG